METFSIRFLKHAVEDLIDIANYYAETSRNPTAGISVIEKLREKINSLSYHPCRHPIWPKSQILQREIRYFRVFNFIIFYSVDQPKHVVTIHAIVHFRRDCETLLTALEG